MRKLFLGAAILMFALVGCDTPGQSGIRAAQLAQRNAIYSEPQGDYFVGRRYFNPNYKFWGYLRRPGQPWRTAQLVMLNEQEGKYAPDRQENQIGADNNSEYRVYGHFTGQTVYEPASNRMLPEFVASGFTLINTNPPSIFAPDAQLPPTTVLRPD